MQALQQGANLDQEDRAWLQGSLALSEPQGHHAAILLATRYRALGAPATD